MLEPHAMEMGELGKRVTKDIVCGRNHTVVVTNCGRVYACGAAGFGRYVNRLFLVSIID